MSTEIARTEGNNLLDRMEYARALASASLLPTQYRQNPGNVLLAMELGDALGIRPIQAINAVHVIEGKPSASADLIASLIRKAGHKLRVKGDDLTATAQIIRADDPEYTFEVTWTIERAKAAGLTGKGVWKNYPAAMLKARAITEVARAGASDALYGVIYTPEELGADVDGAGDVVHQQAPAKRGGMAGLRDAVAKVDDPVDAEVVDDTPQSDGAAPPTLPSEGVTPPAAAASSDVIDPKGKQMKAIHAGMNEAGLGERVAGLQFLTEITGHEVTSSKELTPREAGRVLDELAQINQHPFGDEPPVDES